jgi:hypothetical protein
MTRQHTDRVGIEQTMVVYVLRVLGAPSVAS